MKRLSEGLAQKGHDVTVYTTNIVGLTPMVKMSQRSDIINGVNVHRFQTLLPYSSRNEKRNGQKYVHNITNFIISKVGVFFNKIDESPHIATVMIFARSVSLPLVPQMLPSILLHKDSWDLIIAASLPWATPAIAYLASKLTGTPLVIIPVFHVDTPSYECQSFYEIMKRVNAVIVLTEFERKQLSIRGVPRDKIYVVGVGVDPEKYRNANGDRIRKRFEVNEDDSLVLFIGRREYDKGYHHVITAMERVWKRLPTAKLVLIGSGKSVKLQSSGAIALDQRCKRILQKHKGDVIDLGIAEEREKIDAIAASDIFVMPSRAESFGIAYLEAWMLRKPVIGAYSGAVPYVIKNGVDGLLVKFGNEKQLAKKIITLLQNPALRERLGGNGYQKVANDYTWNVVVDKVENLCREIIAGQCSL